MSEQANTFTKLRTITSHVGHGRFLAECACDDDGMNVYLGSIPRPESIPSPYAYSPRWSVLNYHNLPVVVAEVSHKRYVVYVVDGPIGPVEQEA
jgi:hypothetical protein